MDFRADIERENQLLMEKNAQMKEEMAVLERQLQSAIPARESLEQVAAKNSELQQRIASVEAERDELKARLTICLQRIAELEAQKEEQMFAQHVGDTQEVAELKLRIEQTEIAHNKQVADMQRQRIEVDRALQEAQVKAKEANSMLTAMLKAGSTHFGEEVVNCEQLLAMLLVPPRENCEIEVSPTKRKRKKRTKKVETVIECDPGMNQEMEYAMREIELEMEEVKNKLSRCEEERNKLEKENANLKEELAGTKGTLTCVTLDKNSQHLSEMIELSEKVKTTTQKLSESERKRETLKKQLRPLLTKVHTLETNLTKVTGEMSDLKAENKRLSIEKESLIKECKTLQSDNDEGNAIQNSLKEKNTRIAAENEELKRMIEAKANEVEQLAIAKGSLEKIRDEDKETRECNAKQIESLMELAQKNESLYQAAKNQLEEESNLRREAETQVKKLREQLIQSRKNVEISDLIGLAALTTEKFPVDLAQSIQDIANNPTLMPPTQLRQIFSIVNCYFTSAQTRLEQQIKELEQRPGNKDVIDQFLQRAFPEYASQFQDLADSLDSWNRFTQLVSDLRQEEASTLRRAEQMEDDLSTLYFSLGVDDKDSAMEKITTDHQLISTLKDQLEDLKGQLEKISCESEAEREEQAERQQKDLQLYQQKIDELQQKCDVQKEKEREILSTLSVKCTEMNDKNIELLAKVKALEATVQKLYADLAQEKQNSFNIAAEKDRLEKTLDRVRHTHKLSKLREKELRKQMERLKATFTPTSNAMSRDVQEFVDKRTQSLQLKLTDMEQTIVKLKEELSVTDNERASESKRANDLQLKLQKLALESEMTVKSAARERKLIEESMKHQQVLSNSKLQNTICELNSKLRSAKREVMTNVILQFSSLFDFTEELSDCSFAAFLDNIRSKMMDFISAESRLRRILSLAPNQSIEAEVTHIVLAQKRV